MEKKAILPLALLGVGGSGVIGSILGAINARKGKRLEDMLRGFGWGATTGAGVMGGAAAGGMLGAGIGGMAGLRNGLMGTGLNAVVSQEEMDTRPEGDPLRDTGNMMNLSALGAGGMAGYAGGAGQGLLIGAPIGGLAGLPLGYYTGKALFAAPDDDDLEHEEEKNASDKPGPWYNHPVLAGTALATAIPIGAGLMMDDEKEEKDEDDDEDDDDEDDDDVVTKVAQIVSLPEHLMYWGALPAAMGAGVGLMGSQSEGALGKFLDTLKGAGTGASIGLGAGTGQNLGRWAGYGLGQRGAIELSKNPDVDFISRVQNRGEGLGMIGGLVGGGYGGWKLAELLGLTSGLKA